MNTKQHKRILYILDNSTRKPLRKIISRCLVLIFALFCVVFPSIAQAAILYLAPSEGNYSQGETFIEEIKLDTEREDINAVEVELAFPKEILEIVDFSDGGSILRLWVERPNINSQLTTNNKQQGIISFAGGIPNGYKGEGLLGKVVFKVKSQISNLKTTTQNLETVNIEFLKETKVLLNDGKGTPAKLTIEGAILKIFAKASEIPEDRWQEMLKEDNIPPERFKIEIHQEPSLFEGKYFINFQAEDKESGIDYYEVKEGDSDWQKTTSPYMLQDQDLESIIKVKAVDKAGNERIEILKPKGNVFLEWVVYVIIGLIAIWIMYRMIRNRIIKKPN